MKTIVVIPTYDEAKNVEKMVRALLAHPELEVLIVDDNSPDGTGVIVDHLRKSLKRLHVLHRTTKEGLGRAYVAGFKKALELGADLIVQMDCDFSHDPKDVMRLVASMSGEAGVPRPRCAPENGDATLLLRRNENDIHHSSFITHHSSLSPALVIGSRYVPGGATPGWPFKRRLISRAGGLFIRMVTGMPLRDPTGGFKCWRAETLRAIDFETVASKGYSFQLEMNHRTWKKGLEIKEIPITFTDRIDGYSKITPGIATESIKIALRLRFGKPTTNN